MIGRGNIVPWIYGSHGVRCLSASRVSTPAPFACSFHPDSQVSHCVGFPSPFLSRGVCVCLCLCLWTCLCRCLCSSICPCPRPWRGRGSCLSRQQLALSDIRCCSMDIYMVHFDWQLPLPFLVVICVVIPFHFLLCCLYLCLAPPRWSSSRLSTRPGNCCRGSHTSRLWWSRCPVPGVALVTYHVYSCLYLSLALCSILLSLFLYRFVD